MKKATVTVTFDDEKLGALEFSLRKEHSSVQEHLEDALNALYEKTVPEPLRDDLTSLQSSGLSRASAASF